MTHLRVARVLNPRPWARIVQSACGASSLRGRFTVDPDKVSCERCKRTRDYAAARNAKEIPRG